MSVIFPPWCYVPCRPSSQTTFNGWDVVAVVMAPVLYSFHTDDDKKASDAAVPAIEQSVGMLAKAGTTVLVGMPGEGAIAKIEPDAIANAAQRIMGSKMGSSKVRVDIPRLVDMYQQGRLKLDELITGRYPLSEINEAIDSVRRGEALRNVIVF